MISDTKRQALDVAYAMFAQYGYEGTSLSMIAEELGISKAALYYHFESKEDLFETLYKSIIQEIDSAQQINEGIHTAEDCINFILKAGFRMIAFLKQDPYFVNLLKQYMLLGLRNEKIRRLNHIFSETNRAYYKSVIELMAKTHLIEHHKKDIILELLLIVDQGLFEQSNKLTEDMLKEIWRECIERIVKSKP